jgi:hypothetical protein
VLKESGEPFSGTWAFRSDADQARHIIKTPRNPPGASPTFGKPAPYLSGEPFNRCTHTALSPKGEIYVSDGYGNATVHKYAPDGKLLLSWGEPGSDPGQFNLVHNICTDADGWVYVADRENHRVQVFDGNGKYETQWNNLHRPCGLYMDYIRHPVCYIGELSVNRLNANLGPRVSIVDNQGKLLSRIGDPFAGRALTSFIGPHGLTVDSHGDLYVAEVCWTLWPGCSRTNRGPTICALSKNTSASTERARRSKLDPNISTQIASLGAALPK